MRKIKPFHALVASLIASCSILVGCAGFGGKTAPTSAEQVWFNTVTNYIQDLITRTITNVVVVTAPDGEKTTNLVAKTEVETNQVPVYTMEPKPESIEAAQTIGGALNTFFPGIGTIIGSILAGGLGVWARMRSYKKSGTVLVQNIEAIREFIKTSIPNGAQYDAAFVKWLSDNQKEMGAVTSVVTLLEKYVTNKQAKAGATEIKNLLDTLTPPTPPAAQI